MAISYRPSNYSASTLQGRLKELTGIWTYDDPNSYDPSGLALANVINRKNTKMLPINRPWHLFKNARGISADQNVAWQDTTAY